MGKFFSNKTMINYLTVVHLCFLIMLSFFLHELVVRIHHGVGLNITACFGELDEFVGLKHLYLEKVRSK